MVLEHAESEIVQSLLIALGVGTDPALSQPWPVYSANEPFAPDNCITVFDTQGVDSGRDYLTGEVLDHQGVQVRVRAKNSSVGRARINAIRSAMAEQVQMDSVTVGDATYVIPCFARIGQVLALGPESTSSRFVFTINVVSAIRRTA